MMPYVRPEFRPDALEAFLREAIAKHKMERRGDYEMDSMSGFGG